MKKISNRKMCHEALAKIIFGHFCRHGIRTWKSWPSFFKFQFMFILAILCNRRQETISIWLNIAFNYSFLRTPVGWIKCECHYWLVCVQTLPLLPDFSWGKGGGVCTQATHSPMPLPPLIYHMTVLAWLIWSNRKFQKVLSFYSYKMSLKCDRVSFGSLLKFLFNSTFCSLNLAKQIKFQFFCPILHLKT